MRYLTLLLLPLLLAGCSKAPQSADAADAPSKELPKLFPAPQFTLTNELGQPFGSDNLKGKVWIATLFFTSCPGPCPMMTAKLRHIQEAVKSPNVCMVSISVDPEHDTPAKMKEYADNVDADTKRWFFLTGGLVDTEKVATGLNLGYTAAEPGKPLTHSTLFLLFDQSGQCRGIYHTDDEGDMSKIAEDAKTLADG